MIEWRDGSPYHYLPIYHDIMTEQWQVSAISPWLALIGRYLDHSFSMPAFLCQKDEAKDKKYPLELCLNGIRELASTGISNIWDLTSVIFWLSLYLSEYLWFINLPVLARPDKSVRLWSLSHRGRWEDWETCGTFLQERPHPGTLWRWQPSNMAKFYINIIHINNYKPHWINKAHQVVEILYLFILWCERCRNRDPGCNISDEVIGERWDGER